MSGVPVSVDSEDLEVLLMATGVVKTMESVVAAAKQDDQFAAAQPRLAAAHDRLANRWRHALRRQSFPEMFRDPNAVDIAELTCLDERGARDGWGIDIEPGQVTRQSDASLRHLLTGGWIEFGVYEERVLYTASGAVLHRRHPNPRCRLTARGIEVVDKNTKTEGQQQ